MLDPMNPSFRPCWADSRSARSGFLSAILLGLITLLPTARAATSLANSATPAASLKILKDFKVELVYNVPKDQEGSWVSMCVDPKGRLIVSDQYGKLYRITPPAPDARDAAAEVRILDIPVGQAQGLLYAFNSLYVMVANDAYQGRGLYRVPSSDDGETFGTPRLLRKLSGGGEHGPHAILPSPDGRNLTIISGNQTRVTDLNASRVPRLWSEDHLLPRLWDGNGFMKGVLAPGGWIAITDPDAKSWELVATGFRNEYDAAYNRYGDLFTYDADMEWDMNTPWYRPTRVNLVTSGAEFGWRSGAGKWPAYYADSLGSILDIGPGSPTGVTFGYGSRFPAKYQEAYFMCDWSYGKLYAVHLTQDGSGYRATPEEFISGSPLPLTDIVVNPRDGSLYFAIGGRKTQSGLYRVTYTGKESTAPATPRDLAAKERNQRRHLESFHGHADPNAVKEAWPFLSSKDRYLRFAARIAIEHQDPATWREKALTEPNPVAATHALIALARVSSRDTFHRKPSDPTPDPTLQGRILTALDRVQWASLDDGQKLDLLRAYALAFTRLGKPDQATRARLTSKFDPIFPARSRELNAELAQLLVYLEDPAAAEKLVARMAKSPTQEEQLEYARALRVLKTGWTPALRKQYFEWYLKAANFRGGASLAGFLRDMKNDAVATLSDAEKTDLKPILDAKPVRSDPLATLLAGRPTVREWKVADLAATTAKGLRNRNYDRGHDLFGAAGCFNCHRYNNEGAAVGPDLTGVGGRFNAHDLLESIIEPSKEISDQYISVIIRKKDGDDVTGRIVNLDQDGLAVNSNMLDPNATVTVRRSEIASIENSKVSMMPEGLLNPLKEDEILDLLAFALSRANRNDKMFK